MPFPPIKGSKLLFLLNSHVSLPVIAIYNHQPMASFLSL